MREDQITQIIPDVIPRIMFENKFKRFQENINKTLECGNIAGNDPICIAINPNQNTTPNCNAFDELIFDKDFDSFNLVTGPVMVSKTVLSSQKSTKKSLAINTVQVQILVILHICVLQPSIYILGHYRYSQY